MERDGIVCSVPFYRRVAGSNRSTIPEATTLISALSQSSERRAAGNHPTHLPSGREIPIAYCRLYLEVVYSFFSVSHKFIPDISIAPFQAHYYSEALLDYSIDTVSKLTRRSATSKCE